MKPFKSFLAAHLQEYITYRQNLGYQIRPSLSHLRTFDRYLKEQNIEKRFLSPSFFLQLRSDLKIEPRSVNGIISSLRVFFQFLIRKGIYVQNPLQDIPELPENDNIPFIEVHENKTKSEEIHLSEEQQKKVEELYSDDIELYNHQILFKKKRLN